MGVACNTAWANNTVTYLNVPIASINSSVSQVGSAYLIHLWHQRSQTQYTLWCHITCRCQLCSTNCINFRMLRQKQLIKEKIHKYLFFETIFSRTKLNLNFSLNVISVRDSKWQKVWTKIFKFIGYSFQSPKYLFISHIHMLYMDIELCLNVPFRSVRWLCFSMHRQNFILLIKWCHNCRLSPRHLV